VEFNSKAVVVFEWQSPEIKGTSTVEAAWAGFKAFRYCFWTEQAAHSRQHAGRSIAESRPVLCASAPVAAARSARDLVVRHRKSTG